MTCIYWAYPYTVHAHAEDMHALCMRMLSICMHSACVCWAYACIMHAYAQHTNTPQLIYRVFFVCICWVYAYTMHAYTEHTHTIFLTVSYDKKKKCFRFILGPKLSLRNVFWNSMFSILFWGLMWRNFLLICSVYFWRHMLMLSIRLRIVCACSAYAYELFAYANHMCMKKYIKIIWIIHLCWAYACEW